MSVLALESDPARAAMIRQIVGDVVRSELTLVRSKGELLQALSAHIPDLILLPALLPPADEAELLSHVSNLQNSGHLEILATPFLFATEDPPVAPPRGWRRWLGQGKSRPKAHACDPRAFAEQLMWSLRRAEEVRQAYADRSAVTDLGDTPVSDRRMHRRFSADELQGLRAARIKHGPPVRLVDCSAGGALVESDVPLEPESEAVLELVGQTRHDIVPFRVVRCHSSVVESRLIYWGACAFTQPLELGELLRPPAVEVTPSASDHPDRFDIAVKTIVERFVSLTDGEAGSVRSLGASQVTELVAALQEVSHSQSLDPVGETVRYLLAAVIAALQRDDEDHAITFMLIEERLHAALPWLTARFAEAPTSSTTVDKEALYFSLPTAGGGGPSVLNVELSKGSIFEDWQFRLLKTSMYLAALLRPRTDGGASPIEGRERRRHVRVRGRFDGRRLGAISMALAIRDLSVEGCFVDSLHDEESGRQFTMEVLLPDEGCITVKAEVVCNRPGFGFAVKFTEISDEVRSRLARAVAARAGTVVNSGGAAYLIGESADRQRALSTFA